MDVQCAECDDNGTSIKEHSILCIFLFVDFDQGYLVIRMVHEAASSNYAVVCGSHFWCL